MEVQKGHFTRKTDESYCITLCKPRIRFYSEIELLFEGDCWFVELSVLPFWIAEYCGLLERADVTVVFLIEVLGLWALAAKLPKFEADTLWPVMW